ncbi:hypothetical protein [Rhodopila sp.]|uniref:hypothetical protein n=1 Tax=Rhodopila sp. TaxID=2480087 RepID=UPI003D0B640D
MNTEIQTALNNYRVDQNRERGWSIEAENASYAALKSACEKHGVEINSLFRPNSVDLAGAGKAVITGAGPYALEVFDPAAVLPASMTDGVTVHVFDAGKHFDLMPGVSVVDHRITA